MNQHMTIRACAIHAGLLLGLTACAVRAEANPVDAVIYSTRGDTKVHILAAGDLSPLGSIDIGVGAHELACSNDGRWVIGSAYGGPGAGHQPADKRLVIIDMKAGAVHKTIDLGSMQRPNDIAFLPGTSEAVVTVEAPPNILRVNAAEGTFSATPIEQKYGHMLALSRDAESVYVSHVVPGGVSILNLASGKVESLINVPEGAEGIAASPDGKRLWVASNRAGKVSIIDTVERKLAHTFECEGFPFRVRFSPDGRTVAISCPKDAEVAFFDAADPEKMRRVSVMEEGMRTPIAPTSVAFVPSGREVAAMCDGVRAQIVLIDVAASKVVSRRNTEGPIPDALTAGRVLWSKQD